MKDGYWTVREEARAEITIKRSVFRAILVHQESKAEAMAFLDQLRKEYWDAVHHCYAYRVGEHGLDYRMSDDGEPSGTAGKPILFAMQRADVTNAMLVVVRWYGGVKLGVGPLARAYAEVAGMALSSVERLFVQPQTTFMIHAPYDDVSRITELLIETDCTYEPGYADSVTFMCSGPLSKVEYISHEVVERTNGRAGFSRLSN